MSASSLEWKSEPASPLLDTERDAWLFFDDDVDGPEFIAEAPSSSSSSPSRAEVAQQLLDDIENYVKKESNESFSDWFEEKVNLPIFDEIPSILPAEEYAKPPGLTQDLQEFDYVFNHGQLTPPQSPPTKETRQLTPSYEESSTFILPDENVQIAFQPATVFNDGYLIQQNFVVQSAGQPTYITLLPPNLPNLPEPVQKSTVDASFLTAPPTPLPDIEKELAVVDEVVRNTAENLDSNWDQWETETSHSEASSDHSEASSEGFVCSSPQCSSISAEEESDDPEWKPDDTRPAPGKVAKSSKKRKPYSRSGNHEDKRLRKMEQNKTAATRYRQKKKAEVSVILEEEKILEDKHAELEQKATDIKAEIKYLKGLMRDLFKAKGLIK